MLLDFPHGSDSKETACNAGDLGFDPWVGNIPWRREWLPTPVFLSGKFHGQRTLVGHSPWGCKESNMSEYVLYVNLNSQFVPLVPFPPVSTCLFSISVSLFIPWKIVSSISFFYYFSGGSVVKNPPAIQETWVSSLGLEEPLEKEMGIYSSILVWEIPWTEEPEGLKQKGSQELDMT